MASATACSAEEDAALTQLVREFGKARSPAGVYACRDVMASAPPRGTTSYAQPEPKTPAAAADH